MEIGKLPPELLERMLGAPGATPDGLVLGPGPGRDAAVVQLDDRYLVLAADPISFPTPRPGWYAVHVNANDVACLGADPRWFLCTALAPPGSDASAFDALFDDLQAACRQTRATLVGGHTEITDAVDRLVLSGTMIGEMAVADLVRSDGACEGDALIQVGPIAIEATAVLAVELRERLLEAGLDDGELTQAGALLDNPGISVLPAARALRGLPGLHAMHDPTEGGIATAAAELATAANLSPRLDGDAVLRHPLTERLAAVLDLDPLGLLASGTLLAAIDPEAAAQILGEAFAGREGRAARDHGQLGIGDARRELPHLLLHRCPMTAGLDHQHRELQARQDRLQPLRHRLQGPALRDEGVLLNRIPDESLGV